jgi:hypothetical protein
MSIKLKSKKNVFSRQPSCYITLNQTITLTEAANLSKVWHVISLLYLKLGVASVPPTSQFRQLVASFRWLQKTKSHDSSVPSNCRDVLNKLRQNRQIASKVQVEKRVNCHKISPFSGRKLVQNFRFYRTADTPHFNYKCKSTAVSVQAANSDLF